MDLLADNRLALTRREFLGRGATGIGAAALASLGALFYLTVGQQ